MVFVTTAGSPGVLATSRRKLIYQTDANPCREDASRIVVGLYPSTGVGFVSQNLDQSSFVRYSCWILVYLASVSYRTNLESYGSYGCMW